MTALPQPALAFDTATVATTVAVIGSDQIHETPPPAGEWWEGRPLHSQELLPLARSVLAEGDIELGDLRAIVVGVGPGTYTGLRIGVATARALAHSLRIPIWQVSSLDCLALGASELVGPHGCVIPLIDARRREVFSSVCRLTGSSPAPLERVGEEQAIDPQALAHAVAEMPSGAVAVGDGAIRFKAKFVAAGVRIPADDQGVHAPRARHLFELAAELDPQPLSSVIPTYLRLPDAEISLRARSND